MRLLRATVPSDCEVGLIGDTHEGNPGCSHDGQAVFREWVMADRNRRFVHLGDAVEAIMTDDKRYSYVPGQCPVPTTQAKTVAAQYRPLGKRCLAWLSGNHEGMLARYGDLVDDHICEPLGIQYGGRVCKLALHDRHGLICKLFLWHPSRVSIRSNAKDLAQQQANKLARLKMLMERKAADCLVMAMGHTHLLMVMPPARRLILNDDGRGIQQHYLEAGRGTDSYIEPDRRYYVNTGSYLRSQILGVDGYAEIAGYDPVELGHVVVTIRDRRVAGVETVIGV